MTSIQLEIVRDALQDRQFDRRQLHGPHLRLVDAWTSTRSGSEIWADILALVSQILRQERLTNAVPEPWIEAPLHRRGIDSAEAELFGLRATPVYGGVRLELGEEWTPSWLSGDYRWVKHATASPGQIRWATERPISTEARIHNDELIPIDPAVNSIAPDMTHYRSRAQAISLRAVAFAERGSTVHVVLPTGSGKSLVGIIPGLLEPSATTVVVVPTVALALDQEHQSRHRYRNAHLPNELAYHGDRSREEKRAMRERLVAGTQRLLFTSPESLVQSLAEPLRNLARRGGLTYLVVDEAHLVYSWGTDFRPEFQLAAALVTELRDIARQHSAPEVKTILMTATLSAPALRLNDDLFSDGRSLFVGTNYLRTELRYLLAQGNQSERLERVVEAMRHCPKPAIVYTTKRQDTEDIADLLRGNGFGRVAAFHGDVSGVQRESVLQGWSGSADATSIDIVVGTSAFGLGVDKSDVRTVIHACIPRSVDRFYQEVGRAGRDGHTSLSLWLPSPNEDFGTSRVELARLIGHEKGWNRWIAMRDKAGTPALGSDYSMTVDLRTIPMHNNADGEHNRTWNRNILTILRRAGVITFAPAHPPAMTRTTTESESEWEQRINSEWEESRNTLEVRFAGGAGGLDEAAFEHAFQCVKQEVQQRENESFGRIRDLLALETCWGKIFADEYSLSVTELPGADYRLSPSCSGCPACNHPATVGESPVVGLRPTPKVPRASLSLMPALEQEFLGRSVLLVTYDPSPSRQDSTGLGRFRRVVTKAIENGIRQIYYSSRLDASTIREVRLGVGTSPLVALDEIDLNSARRSLDYPTLLVAAVGDSLPAGLIYPSAEAVPRVVVVPIHTPTPDRPHLNLEDVLHPDIALEELVRRI